MADRVTLRKQGWTADFISPLTGKRRQVVVESEDAGWALIQQEGQAAATAKDKGLRQAPAAPWAAFRCSKPGSCPGSVASKDRLRPTSPATATPSGFFNRTQLCAISNIWFNQWPESMLAEAEAEQHQPRGLSTAVAC